MDIKTLGVIGAGTMGNGIVHVAAQSGLNVILNDVSEEFIRKGIDTITKNLDRQIKKEKITEADRTATLSRIKTAVSLDAMEEADFIVEAVIENTDVKKNIFHTLDNVCGPDVILSSNTSSISITKIAAWTKRSTKVIGMHFMNPVPMMQLVEVIRGMDTSDETYAHTKNLSEKLGKTPVEVNDYPGFVANRLLMPMINEAVYCLMEGVGKPEAIDTVMKLGMAHPMGPLALADLIGLDTCLYIMEVIHDGMGDTKYRPCPLLRKMVESGHLGRKSGKGFYSYEK